MGTLHDTVLHDSWGTCKIVSLKGQGVSVPSHMYNCHLIHLPVGQIFIDLYNWLSM